MTALEAVIGNIVVKPTNESVPWHNRTSCNDLELGETLLVRKLVCAGFRDAEKICYVHYGEEHRELGCVFVDGVFHSYFSFLIRF